MQIIHQVTSTIRFNDKPPIQLPVLPHEIDLTITHKNEVIIPINLENLTWIGVELANPNSIPEIRLNTHQCSPPGAALLMKSTKL